MFCVGLLKNLVMMVLISVSVVVIFKLLNRNGIVCGRCSLIKVCL